MTGFTIKRWTRYGHDRGYATASDGTKLGWVDLKTGTVTVEAGADGPSVNAALRAWGNASSTVPTPLDLMTQPAARVETPTVPAWTDLAAHRAGQLIHEQAAAKWEADKAESKLFAYGARLFDAKTDERAWRVGTEGEQYIGAKLGKLTRRGWHILHSVPVGKRGSDIDHVVIGPGGVFTVNTKNHRDKRIWVGKHQIRVNGHPVTYLRDARYEAERASKALSRALGRTVYVRPCLAILTGSVVPNVTVKQQPADVKVLTKWLVPMWFRFRPRVLSPDEVDAIYAVARRPDTWT